MIGARTVNWLVYTCLIGLIPVISRGLLWLNSSSGVEPLAISDWVAFGLVLHSSNIHEVNAKNNFDTRWKSVHNGTSAIFIALYGLILFTTIAQSPNMNMTSLQHSTLALCFVSFLLSLSVFYERHQEASFDQYGGANHE